jgi:hypothetical protein
MAQMAKTMRRRLLMLDVINRIAPYEHSKCGQRRRRKERLTSCSSTSWQKEV